MGNIAFVWDNFGPHHVEWCEAVADALPADRTVIGIELFSRSNVYAWGRWKSERFRQITVHEGGEDQRPSTWPLAWRIVRECRRNRVTHAFLCHYPEPYIVLAAYLLRISGIQVFALLDSKFDDFPRFLRREVGKTLFLAPYHGGITASDRSADYLRFLGVNPARIRVGYYTIPLDNIRKLAAVAPAPDGTPFDRRFFLCVARLVPKKNHALLIAAYARYVGMVSSPRRLVLCGSGPLEPAIHEQIATLGLADLVVVEGNVAPPEIPSRMGEALCLLLPSIEEQFGIVVMEAQAMGLPVIVSINCGARDRLVRSGVNGFVVESDNEEGLACFMAQLSDSEPLWRRMSLAAARLGKKGDVGVFVDAVLELTNAGVAA